MKKIELNNPLIMPKVQVANSTISGRGIFAAKDFKRNELIEECHAILIRLPRPSVLQDYVFKWNDKYCAMLTGNGSLYNHSKLNNVHYEVDEENNLMHLFAVRDIKAGEELFITYGDKWFENHAYQEILPSDKKFTWTEILIVISIVVLLIVFAMLTQVIPVMLS